MHWLPGESYCLRAHSFALFVNRAPAPQAMAQLEATAQPDCSTPKAGTPDGISNDGDAPAP